MYINTYILSVPEENKAEYLSIAKTYIEVVAEYGALEVYENWELEVPTGEHTDYRKAVKAAPGEKIVMSWVIWPDRETAAKAHERLPQDERFQDMGEMPFNTKHMVLGGFEPLISYRKGEASA